MMKRVICDTNIWYYLGNGILRIEDFKDCELVATWVNVIELIHAHPETKSKRYNFQEIQNAINAIQNYSNELIFVHPYEFALQKLLPNFEISPDSKKINIMLTEAIEMIIRSDKPIVLDTLLKKEFMQSLNVDRDEFVKNLQPYILERREEYLKLDSLNRKKYLSRLNEKVLIESLIDALDNCLKKNYLSCIIFESEEEIEKDLVLIEEKFIFYLKTMIHFIKQLIKDSKMKIDPNDLGDALNLWYVNEEDFYVTNDKWEYKIKEAGFETRLIPVREIINSRIALLKQ